jgi:aspartate/methionine/tyrosine aminotransferase
MFSSRVPGDLTPNRLTQAIQQVRAAGTPLIDLTLTNPTTAGIPYPASLLEALADPAGLRYAPNPLGLPAARAAIARDYARHGINVAPESVVLTASTSEAYSVLFKLLCDPGKDAVMLPVPSYPLFDHLTQLDGVRALSYRLEYEGRWAVDFDTLDSGWTDTVRAVLAVSPNNPTGSVLTDVESEELGRRCAERDAALIIDEVFADYPLERREAAAQHRRPDCLTLRLGGLSKSAGLPQVKLGWIVVDGPEVLVRGAIERLELICDTYLSVSTPVQLAAPALIDAGVEVRAAILRRVQCNYRELQTMTAAHRAIEVLRCDAGWSAVLRVPATTSEEDLVLGLLEQDGVLVHPGFFFDFPHEAFLIVSLLPQTATFKAGMTRVLERAGA